MKSVLIILTFIALIMGLSGLAGCSVPDTEENPRAAIIDQLGAVFPNDVFVQQVSGYLEEYGFMVDVHCDEAVTVDLYRHLPSYGYEMIIFRVHSGLLGVDPQVTGKTWLYTDEPYSKTRHLAEQLGNQLTFAKTTDDAPWYCAVSGKFFEKSMEGTFNDTVIIMMGCDCLHYEDLAQAFIEKDASIFVAWDTSVLLDYVDSATPSLVEKLCCDGLSVEEAVRQTMREEGADPRYGSVLKYYPKQNGVKTLKQLIK